MCFLKFNVRRFSVLVDRNSNPSEKERGLIFSVYYCVCSAFRAVSMSGYESAISTNSPSSDT